MSTPVTNFGKVTVSTGYNAAAVSIALTAGHGSRLPSTFPYPLTWWNFTDYPDPADDPNREIVTVTARTGDTLTVTRGAESTGASTKNTAAKTYKMLLGITAAMWDALSERALSQSFRGLRVETHPDADLAASQILFNAEAIVMDDGEEVSDWTNIAVDITASGANGLDTGSEAASVWYELWAAYNGTTKIGLLHRAKDYFLDEDVSAGEDGAHALRDNAARTKLSNGFKVDTSGPVPFINAKLIKTGSPAGTYWFTIEADSGGVPSGTPLATSDKYDVSRLTTTATWVRIPFRSPASLSAATQYHLVLQGDFTISAANYMSWRADTSASTYANGSKAAYNGTTWTADTDDDFTFKVYITRNDVALTLPSGYTQSAMIGYAYNNASSNFKHFQQADRTIFCGQDDNWQIGSSGSGTAILWEAEAFIPPTGGTLVLQDYSTTGHHCAAGGLTAIDLTQTSSQETPGHVRWHNPGYSVPSAPFNVGPYQGFMWVTNAGTVDLYVGSFTW